MINVTCLFEAQDKLGEGVIWDAQQGVIWWVDVPLPSAIHRLDPLSGKHDKWIMPEMVMSLSKQNDGRLLVASHHGLNFFDPKDGSLKQIAAPEADEPLNRSNDGGTDAAGRFWFGTMRNNIGSDNSYLNMTESAGNLYRVGADLIPMRMDHSIGITNSIAWSPDTKTMYFADTLISTIFAYDFDLSLGAISNRRIFSEVRGHGYPDGSCVDAEGYLWNARWEGGCVIRFAPSGQIDQIVEVPAARVTCCAFGEADLGTLFITTSRLHLTASEMADQPHAGGLFSCRPGVTGQAPNQFIS